MSTAPDSAIANPRDLSSGFALFWNRHDMAALAGLFAEDAQMVNVVGIWWRNRREIEEAHAALHAGPFKDSHLEIEAPHVTRISPNVVAVHTAWRLSGQLTPDGTPDEERRGILLFVAVDGSDGWRIQVAQNTDIQRGVVVPAALK